MLSDTGRSDIGRGPYFDELAVGQQFSAPAITLTTGLAAAHQAITGDRLALALDHELCRAVTGGDPLAAPSLVWDLAIGQSTVVTQHVKANLYYRGLAFSRAPTGLAALRITTTDQQDRPVLDFWRCAMLPLRDPARQTGHADDLDQVGRDITADDLGKLARGWQLAALAARAGGPHPADLRAGQSFEVAGGDVVSAAPELARLTLNIAAVHHDLQTGGNERLVYGGHAVGLALSQAARALPSLATIVGWHGCDHLAPVREGDTLRSTITVEQVDLLPDGGGLVHLRSVVRADGPAERDVLDWRYVALLA